MDQGVHQFRLAVTVGTPAAVKSKVGPLAEWLSGSPTVYAHLPLGSVKSSAENSLRRILESLPANVMLLACKRSADAKALVVRLQESTGSPTQLALPGSSCFAFRPFEIKTIRLEKTGQSREVDLIWEE